MKVLRIGFCVVLLAVSMVAQQRSTVSGKLMDGGEVVANAAIRLVSAGEAFDTTTDRQGNYRFENVPDGRYLLVYGDKRANVNVRQGSVTIAELAEVVEVSADALQTIDQVSKSVNVIDGQEMRDRADFTLADTLRTIPGFRVQQLGGFGRAASVKSRGLRNQDTAILIDGVRFRDAGAITGDASSFLGDFTLTSVKRIEVLRGAGSSLYGTNAVGGTVDFQTPAVRRGTHGQVSGAFGGLGLKRFRGNVSHGARSGRFGIGAGLSRTVYSDGIDGDDDAHNTNFQTRIDANPFTRTSISGRIFFSDADVRLNTSPNTLGTLPASNAAIIDARPLAMSEVQRYAVGTPLGQLSSVGANFIPDVNDPDNKQQSRFFSGQISVNHAVNDKLVISGFYQGLDTERRNTNGRLGVGFQPFSGDETDRFGGQIHTINGHFGWTPSVKSRTTAGYEYESEDFENYHLTVTPTDNFSVGAKQTSNTLFAQQLISLADGRLQLAGGFRAQFFSLRRPVFTPVNNPTYQNLVLDNPSNAYTADGSVSYFFRSTGTKLRAHVGNGYRVPSLYERFGSFYFFGSFSSSGDPNLEPERSLTFDAGIEQSLLKDRVRLTGTYFYTDIHTAIDFAFCVPFCLPSPDPLARFSGYYNTDGRIARGIETSADLRPTRSTTIFTSYTFANSDERKPLNLFVQTSPGIPSHQFSLVLTQRIKERFWVNFDFVATSSYLFPFYNFNGVTFEEKYYMYRFAGSRRGDLTAGYTFPLRRDGMSLRLFGTIENVFDREYYENGFRTSGATGRIGLSFGF